MELSRRKVFSYAIFYAHADAEEICHCMSHRMCYRI